MWGSLSTGGRVGLIAGGLGALVAVTAAIVSAFADPGDTVDIIAGVAVVCIFMLIVLLACLYTYRNVLAPMSRQRRLQQTGLPAEATIIALKETGITVNDAYPVVRLVLEVRPPGGQPYRAEVQTVIGRLDVPEFQPGTVVAVKCDPKDPSNVALADAPETGEAESPAGGT